MPSTAQKQIAAVRHMAYIYTNDREKLRAIGSWRECTKFKTVIGITVPHVRKQWNGKKKQTKENERARERKREIDR